MFSLRRIYAFRSNQSYHDSSRIVTILVIALIGMLVIAPAASAVPRAAAQDATAVPTLAPTPVPVTPPSPAPADLDSSAQVVLLIILSALVILALPVGYLLFSRTPRTSRSVLLVSTDEEARRLVIEAAKRAGFATVAVYRYEDALERLRQDFTLAMIVIDDSVPQYEAGLLVSMLMRLPSGIRPLILIHDSSEMGQTAPSYRAEVVVSRPLTIKALEAAIRQVSEQTAIDF